MVYIYSQELDAPDRPLEYFAAVLSADERQRADRFCRPRDAQRFTVARGMLRRTLGGILATAAESIRFSYGAHGKPSLATADGEPLPLQFNLAHSSHRAMLAVAAAGEIGIDIEKIRPVKSLDGIVAKHFSPLERAAFQALPQEERLQAFFRVWTRKEAVVKAIGTGLALSLTSFDVSLAASPAAALLGMRSEEHAGWPWSLLPLQTPHGFCAALAVAHSAPIRVHYVEPFA